MKHGKSVAIVGVGGIFPMAPTLGRFWETITANISTSRQPPQGRWLLDADEIFAPTVGAPDKIYSKKGCFIDDEDGPIASAGLTIDADFLSGLDPLFHLLLRTGHQAFSDSRTDHLDRQRVGVIIGNLALPSEYSSTLARDYLGGTFAEQLPGIGAHPRLPGVNPLNRYVAGLPAGILAKALNLGGTCYTLDAACASSLYAVKLAMDELLSGRADAMLTGGLSRPDSLYTQMGFSQLHALSPSGTCSPFDRNGDGLVVGEGSGMFLLKRTADAVRDGDHIYAVIRGIGLSNDLGGTLLAPASEGQLRAMRAAYKQAGWSPADVDLIECHATGTPVGDVVEFASLKSLWGDSGWKAGQCVIGSVKSNIGHLLTAAGSAALMKALLAIKERTLPPTANFTHPAKGIDLDTSPFKILSQTQDWKARKKGQPRRAAVSAFGFGGINAHLLIEEWIPHRPEKSSVAYLPSSQKKQQPIAIVGLGAHVGAWDSLATLRSRLLGSSAVVEPTSPARWWGADQSGWFADAGLKKADFKGFFTSKVQVKAGTFRIPPKEIEDMLPRQLLMLKVADEALQDAGIKNEELLFTGVFIGTGLDLNATNFSFRWSIQKLAQQWANELQLDLSAAEMAAWVDALRESAAPPLSANRVMGALGSVVASRVAKEFKVGGPSFTISNEENSGLRALEVGVRALQEGSINRAIVGAVDMAGDLRAVLGQHAAWPFSRSGTVRPFDKDADGTVVGEGAAAVILKRLDDARQDGDRIYAVIGGVGSAIGGGAESTSPEQQAYTRAIERAVNEAGIRPESVSYLETDGSGLARHDELEANALGAFFGTTQNANPCYIGSAKGDVGHAGAAAGLVSLIKAALCLDQKILPPLRNVQTLRYNWVRGKRNFVAPESARFWLRNRAEGPRRALVSGLGSDGSCSQVILEGIDDTSSRVRSLPVARPLGALDEGLFALAADDVAGLLALISRLQQFAALAPEGTIDQLAAQWYHEVGLAHHHPLCVALVVTDRTELFEHLEQAALALRDNPGGALGGSAPPALAATRDRLFYTPRPLAPEGKVAFVFPGSGNHFAGMGCELSARWPAIYRRQDSASEFLARQFLPEHFWKAVLAEAVHDNHNALVIGQVAVGTAISDLVRSFGIEPQAVSGYSLGESAGLFSLQAWEDRDGMARRLAESPLFTEELAGRCTAARKVWNLHRDESVDWVLGIVDVPADRVRQALINKNRAYLLIVNTHRECVIGGDRRQVEALAREVNGHFFPLRGVTTVHCEVVAPVAKGYRELHLFPVSAPPGIDFYSCARGERYPPTTDNAADVILEQALTTVDYTRVIKRAYADGVRIFLEMGPGNSGSRMISSILEGQPHLARAACYPGPPPTSLILRLLANCLAERVPVNLAALYPESVKSIAPPAGPYIETTIGGAPFTPAPPPQPPLPLATATEHFATPENLSATIDVPDPASAPSATPLVAQLAASGALNAQTHGAYLNFAATMEQTLTANIHRQLSLFQQLAANGATLPQLESLDFTAPGITPQAPVFTPLAPRNTPVPLPAAQPPLFNRAQCMELAIGSCAAVLGPEFAEVDNYPTRVRLPDEPLMLVDRIMAVEGKPRSMTRGRVITEHDVTADRWYLDGGRMPTCIAVEAGQADLFLSGYLGIDFISKGQAVYRLLDAVVTFHRTLPVPGDVIRYDIRIDEFFRQDQTYLFRFNFEGTVNGEPLLSMRNGVAGFFTAQELAAGQGIVHTKLDRLPQPGTRPADWRELVPLAAEAYNEDQVAAIYAGDLATAFGALFSTLPLTRPYTLPGGYLKLVDRVIELDPQGGRYGLGLIRAEMDIHPDDWFLTSHFCDDHVMPGTLMYECCMHTLRIYLLRMGWVGAAGSTWCEPLPGVNSGLKCRGQVVETTRTVTYQVSIKELGYAPEPFAIGDALMFADGKPIVEIPNMSLRLAGLTREKVERLWVQNTPETPETSAKQVLYDYDKILAYAIGKPSEAFGEPYRIFDQQRKIARLPGPPFQFLDRITAVSGEAFKLVAGATCTAEYDVPHNAWYFNAGRQPEMPFSILLETGLQPCGWLAAYLGSALTSQTDLKFRNLDGNAIQQRPVTPQTGTLTTQVKITRIASSGGMIIQNYDFTISDQHGPIYTGDTVFGFFSAESLAQQVGVRDAQPYAPAAAEADRAEQFDYPRAAPFPETQLRMIDRVEQFIADGGPHGLGFIRGSKRVDANEWFFKAHFYQDPVCPGSLGLESFLQLLKVVAAKRWNVTAASIFTAPVCGEKHRWNYRGQIVPQNNLVLVEAVVTAVDDARQQLTANGYLSVDGKIIYQMNDFKLRIQPSFENPA
ncbi:MAG: beta-ketoacyl synthase N-terminal-like domain-containing protein [Desulfuromonadales bacterium]|nr:beta-ketoacyl synthase N-terminal-like domain-containing protein [Desulfuromonadales bacterium]